jgi:hypothetical protein
MHVVPISCIYLHVCMLVVACFVGIPMCYSFSHIILVTWDLGRMLESLHHALFAKSEVNHGSWLTCL